MAHFVERLADAHTFPVALHHKAAHAVVALGRIGVSKNGEEVGHRRPGDKCFGAIKDVMVAFFAGSGFNPGHVGASFWFSEAVAGHLPINQTAAIFLLLFFAASDENGQDGQPIDAHCRAHAGAAPGQLFRDHAFFKQAQAETAVFFRHVEGGEAKFLRLFDDGPGIFVGLVVMFGNGGHFVAGEIAGQLLDHFLLVVEGEVDCAAHFLAPFYFYPRIAQIAQIFCN